MTTRQTSASIAISALSVGQQ